MVGAQRVARAIVGLSARVEAFRGIVGTLQQLALPEPVLHPMAGVETRGHEAGVDWVSGTKPGLSRAGQGHRELGRGGGIHQTTN